MDDQDAVNGKDGDGSASPFSSSSSSESDNCNGEAPQYAVSALLGRKNTQSGSVAYLVKYEGYSSGNNEWREVEELDCDELIRAYNTTARAGGEAGGGARRQGGSRTTSATKKNLVAAANTMKLQEYWEPHGKQGSVPPHTAGQDTPRRGGITARRTEGPKSRLPHLDWESRLFRHPAPVPLRTTLCSSSSPTTATGAVRRDRQGTKAIVA